MRFFKRYANLELPPHAVDWIKAALAHDRVLINCPPRHAKSEILSVWWPIWHIACDRDIQILIISQTEKLAKKMTNKISWVLEFHTELISDFGRFRPDDDSSAWRPLQGELMVRGRERLRETGDMTLQVRGKGQQILGMEADLIVGDDVVGRSDAWSQAERDRTSEYWHGDVMSRRSPRGRVVVIGQRLHHEDLYGELAAKRYTYGSRAGEPVWHHIVQPAVIDWETETTLWPDEWPFDRLMETYEDLKRRGDAWLFDAMYQQQPLPPSARLVKPEWIERCLDEDRALHGGYTQGYPAGVGGDTVQDPKRYVRVISVDPSPEHFTAFVVADVRPGDDLEIVIIEIIRRRVDVRRILEILEKLAQVYSPKYLIWEQNAFARWFLQDPRLQAWDRSHKVRVIPHTTGRNKADPQYGIGALAHLFEWGKIRLPWGDPSAQACSRYLIEEAEHYIPGLAKASGTTDVLMATWFIYYNHKRLIPSYDVEPRSAGRTFHVPQRLQKGYRWARTR